MYHLCLDGEVTDVTGHLLDAGERWAGDLVAAENGVDVDKNAGLPHKVSIESIWLQEWGYSRRCSCRERWQAHPMGR